MATGICAEILPLEKSDIEKLSDELRRVLPDASLAASALPGCSPLALYLIDVGYAPERLDPAVALRVMNNPLYWLFCWASGRVLAGRILAAPELVQGKIVLDVGSGSGVVAIAAVLAGAQKVIASDIDPVAQLAIRTNAALNQVDIEIIGDYREYRGAVDLIILADVLYDRDNLPLLNALLERAPDMVLADSRVKNFAHERLEKIAACAGETFPALGGFDEFNEVNIYRRRISVP